MAKKRKPRSDMKTVRNDYIKNLYRKRYTYQDIARHMTSKGEPMTAQRVKQIVKGTKKTKLCPTPNNGESKLN